MNTRASRHVHLGWKQLIAGLLIPTLLALQLSACGSPSDQAGRHSSAGETPDEIDSNGGVALFDGETVFKGAFFGMGPVAELIPEIWTNRDLNFIKAQLSSPGAAAKAQEAAAAVEEVARELRAHGYGDATAQKARKIADDVLTLAQSPDELAKLLDRAAADVRHGSVSAAAAVAVNRTMDQIKARDSQFFERFGTEVQSGNHLRISRALQMAGKEFARATLADPVVGPAVSERTNLRPEQDISAMVPHAPSGDVNLHLERDYECGQATSGGGGTSGGAISWVNAVQTANVVQAVNFVQVQAAALFVVAAIVYIAAFALAAFIAVPARGESFDALQGDLLVNALATRLRTPSAWTAGRVYEVGDFARIGNRIYQATRDHIAEVGSEPSAAIPAQAASWRVVAP
jgi:hypothetical protein